MDDSTEMLVSNESAEMLVMVALDEIGPVRVMHTIEEFLRDKGMEEMADMAADLAYRIESA